MTDIAAATDRKTQSPTTAISAAIERLRQFTQLSIQEHWHWYPGDLPPELATTPETWTSWPIAPLNDRHHIAWPKGHHPLWLTQRLTPLPHLPLSHPPHLSTPSPPHPLTPSPHYPLTSLTLRLALTWWAESAQIFINGQLVQAGDLFDCSTRLLLSPSVQPGEPIDLAIRLVSPGHDDGALVRSVCLYEQPDHQVEPCPEPGFVADELAVLQDYVTTFAPERLGELAAAIEQIDWSAAGDRAAFERSLIGVRQQLQPLGDWVKQRCIYLLGHAHLDLAWLWPIAATWEAAERTFKSVLQLQQEFPELVFGHSTPALYDWLEMHRPTLFQAICAQIQANRWEVIAGLWVEPELNTVSGESIVRQVLYGQRYVQERFGRLSRVAWLPDSFGFCGQLPQILKQGGVDYFVTQKLRWNDRTEFPHDLFLWRSPDGSTIASLHSAPIGEGIDPVKMARYACQWEQKTGSSLCLWLPGVGDHGGGPTRDMLELARRWQRSPFFPQLQFTAAVDFLDRVTDSQNELSPENPEKTGDRAPSTQVSDRASNLPVWNDELYLEFHRGCYTTHADQKRWNRSCERLLYQAELYASIATLLTNSAYPQAELEQAWKQILFNQFHDILPGSAIAEVYEVANQSWQAAEQTATQIGEQALHTIAAQIDLSHPPHPEAKAIVVFNPLNWERSQVVELEIPQVREAIQQQGATMDGAAIEIGLFELLTEQPFLDDATPATPQFPKNVEKVGHWQVCDRSGNALPHQSRFPWKLSFLADRIPGLGYRCFWLVPVDTPWASSEIDLEDEGDRFTLENEFLRVRVDPQTGDLASVFDKQQQREVLRAAGNQLQAFHDAGQYWDAWNIDPNYAAHPLPAAELLSISPLTRGAIETQIQVERQIGQSVFQQTYILEQGSPLLKIATIVDWQERHTLVKAAFPLHVTADGATYEMPYGTIERSTRPTTDREKAMWEVPALHWACLKNDQSGVSLLNDCKYGYDAQPDQLRLTLLRGSEWPNPNADRGLHTFTYALYSHPSPESPVPAGYELNQPVRTLVITPNRAPDSDDRLLTRLPAAGQFLQVSGQDLIVTALKRSETNQNHWILRGYEYQGNVIEIPTITGLIMTAETTIARVDLLERPIASSSHLSSETRSSSESESSSDHSPNQILPWQIVSLAIEC